MVIIISAPFAGHHSRHSSTARVPQLSCEDNSQEQNVPQHIDLTADDEEEENVDNDDVISQNILSADQQDDSELFEEEYVSN